MEAGRYPSRLVASKKIVFASLHRRKGWKRRLYGLPFAIAYVGYGVLAAWLMARSAWSDLYWVPLVLVAAGHALSFLACHWSVAVDAFLTCSPASVETATLVRVVPREHGGKAELVPLLSKEGTDERYFVFQQQKFIYNADRKMFEKLHYPVGRNLAHYWGHSEGLSVEEAKAAEAYYGRNRFEMSVPSFMELFREHAVAPFFVFQVFCVGLWCLDEYWYYSVFTLLMLVVFESTVVAQRLKNLSEFRAMSLPNVDILVRRGAAWVTCKTEDLLPGDLVVLQLEGTEEVTVPCDVVLLAGTCIVNEAMISGESTPMLKESLLEACQAEEAERPLEVEGEHRNHLLFGGTKMLQITAPAGDAARLAEQLAIPKRGNVCVAYVLRTGFGTLQGKLVRTMIFTSERMTANNAEAFAFILFLLIFAVAAAGYVLYWAWGGEGRGHFKLLLECTLIITAVVPPELPMELSLAVNNSLIALGKFAIFCMEPFRIPLAGKLDVCCFDKTGTLTGENLVVKGVVASGADGGEIISEASKLETGAVLAIASCHSLFLVGEGKVVGDPMERTALEFVGAKMSSNDAIQVGRQGIRILHRFPFSSALKRMSCIVQCTSGSLMVTCKGAPEVIEERLARVPSWYRRTFTQLAHTGARVLALATKTIPNGKIPSAEKAKHLPREQAETELTFAGFLVFHCPLKPDSKEAIAALRNSLHHVVMITGDNSLTAIHTAFDLGMVSKPVLVLQQEEEADISISVFDPSDLDAEPPKLSIDWRQDGQLPGGVLRDYGLAMTGMVVETLSKVNPTLLSSTLAWVTVFARASPSQKELILTSYKGQGYITMMCGDGTNDVGALKQSHVGVALLDGRPEDLPKILRQMQTVALRKRQIEMERQRLAFERRFGASAKPPSEAQATQQAIQKRIEAMTTNLEQEEIPLVRLGDASVAAPFTSKISTIQAVCNLVRQGRCTLVTTMQMYKILALNSLISAYGLSVLHLEGIRYGDFQVTVTGMLLAGCFLFLSKAKPIQKLAAHRPQPNIFNWYVLMSVLLQFLLHVSMLWFVVSTATRWSFRVRVDENTKFAPGLVNTTVYLVSLLMQVSTFVVNYQVRRVAGGLMVLMAC